MLYSDIVIVGCGNTLHGDDGFGPAVVEELQKLTLPDNVTVLDAGLGAPHFVFTLLDPSVTRRLIVIDIADFGGEPGEIRLIPPEALPPGSYRDAHSWDLTEPLLRLKEEIEITVIGCQPKSVEEFDIGLTNEIQDAIPRTVKTVLDLIGVDYGNAFKHLQEHLQEGCQCESPAKS